MNWSVITINPQGHPLTQPASCFNEAWLLSQPPACQANQWITPTMEEVNTRFNTGAIQVTVAERIDGTIRIIHRII
jgi:hypothetical protein